MKAAILEFPKQPHQPAPNPFVAMTMTKVVNGKTVIMNIAKMSKEEFLAALLSDAVMRERQELVGKLINS